MFDTSRDYYRYFITLWQTDPKIGFDHMRENPDYRVLPALYEIEQKFEKKTRIKVYQVANMSNSVKHVTLAIDIHRHLKRSELFNPELFPGCKIIGISGQSADFSDEEDEDQYNHVDSINDWGNNEGWGHGNAAFKQNAGVGLTTENENFCFNIISESVWITFFFIFFIRRSGSGRRRDKERHQHAWIRQQSFAADPLLLVIETHNDLDPPELYAFIKKYVSNFGLENSRQLVDWIRFQNSDVFHRTGQMGNQRWLVKCSNDTVRQRLLQVDGYRELLKS